VYIIGGLLSLITSPIFGKLADRYGKLQIFRIVAPLSAVVLVAITFLPKVSPLLAVVVVSTMFITNSGRMIAAMAMITGTVPPQQRGAFMTANASIQHIASGLGTLFASLIIVESKSGKLEHFGLVGLLACGITLVSIWLAGNLRPLAADKPVSAETELSAVTAAEHG
jgi:predicted MFS family arabinose efflux permease